MKKLYAGIIVSIFLMSTFLAVNLYNSTSFPGYGGNKECNYCHNQPAFVKDMNNTSFGMGNWKQAEQVFSENNGQWATDEVPTVQTNNRSNGPEFVKMTFIKNQTDIMVMAQVPDNTLNNTVSATSDKFGIIFNIDVKNFSVGQFLTSYNGTQGTPLNQVLSGQMEFTNGHADLWYVDMAKTSLNSSTSMAQDEFISTGIASDGATHQDVHVMVFYGAYSTHGFGYEYIFVRKLNTNDQNDVQFGQDGVGIHYVIAHWDASSTDYHISSFDQMIIVGNNNIDGYNGAVNGIVNTIATVNNNFTSTYSEPASYSTTAGTFAIVAVLALIAIAIPIIAWIRPRK